MAGLLWYRSYMDSLANTSGYYPDIHAGHADRVPELTLNAPYLIQETPAGYNQLELMELVGGSVAWNQFVTNLRPSGPASGIDATYSGNGVWELTGTATANVTINVNQSTFRLEAGHVYYCSGCATGGTANSYFFGIGGMAIDFGAGGIWKNGNYALGTAGIVVKSGYSISGTLKFKPQIIDLTAYLGPTIADYVYSLEQATAGSGIAWLKKYDLIDDQYHAYSAPTLQSVEATAHVTKDANDNVISTTTFGSVTLRGMTELVNGALKYNGDTYEPDGTVTRYFGERAYQAGDESLTDAITDGTNTVYKLGAPTTESADPYTAVQTVEDGGTEEFVTGNNVPVGNVSVYRRA